MAAAEAAGSAAVLKERGGAAFKAGEFDEAVGLREHTGKRQLWAGSGECAPRRRSRHTLACSASRS